MVEKRIIQIVLVSVFGVAVCLIAILIRATNYEFTFQKSRNVEGGE